jgi:hypothetical protein
MKKIEYKQALNRECKDTDNIPVAVTGYDFGVPGLAVRKAWGSWQIDHVPSGYRVITYHHTTRRDCVGCALRAQEQVPGIDWTASKEAITSERLVGVTRDWRDVFERGHVYSATKREKHSVTVCHGWTLGDLESFTYDGLSEGLCGACGEVSGNHEPDATNNWCPGCEELKVTSALVLAGMI